MSAAAPHDLEEALEGLHASDPAAAQLLGVAAHLGEAPIPGWLVAGRPEVLPDPLAGRLAQGPERVEELARSLAGAGLATSEGSRFTLVDGVAGAVRERMTARERSSFGRVAVTLLHRCFPDRVGREQDADRARALAPHVRAAARHPSGGGRATSEAAHTLARLAAHLRQAGRPGEARAVLEEGVETAHRGAGTEPVLRLLLLDELAAARAGLDDPDGAVEAVDRALRVLPAVPRGSPHRPMLLANLGATCREVGALGRARACYEAAVKEVEVERVKTARPIELELLIGRADAELSSGDAGTAERTAARAVELAEEHVGEIHAFTVRALWLRADALRESGREGQATELYRRALVAEAQLLGTEHPSVGQKLLAFGLHLSELGRRDAAAEHVRRAHDVFESALGPDADPTRAAAAALADLAPQGAG